MPQINRIRIINFSYNSNNRHIVDQTFDFYKGENALLSLKNGGGKSVLVQLLLQPIIPKTKLMSRRIEDFFKGKKTPAYILIEWKLDDQGGYLLTGIGLTNRERQVRDQDDVNNSLKYFTFTSNYRESNLFDIENIPLIKKQNEKIYIEDYKKARSLISSKEKDLDYNIKLYTDEDKLEYKKDLASYNISQDEWRSIILKINESEGGVIEIFEKCKTSQQLMNDWILKTIEKVVNKEDKDQKKLEQMLENLVEEMISNEQFIYDKEIYEDFLKESNQYLDKLNSLVSSLDKEQKLENNIATMYYYLKNEINKMKDEINAQNDKILNSQKELEKINLEERSKQYYDILEKVDALTKLCEDESKQLELVKHKISTTQKQALIQQAAREYKYIKELNKTVAGINEEIEKIKNSDQSKEKIRNLEYSLKIAYDKILKQLNEKSVNVINNLKDIDLALNQYNNQIKEFDEKSNDLQNKNGRIQSNIESFEKNENKIKNELQLTYQRNLLGEIQKDYKDKYIKDLENNISSLNKHKHNINTEIENSKNKIPKIAGKINQLRIINEQNIVEATILDNKIKEYNKIESSIKLLFNKYDIDFKRRFNHKENQAFIENRINELQKTERELDLNVRTINENITLLKDGTLHVSKEFRQLLVNKDIDFETGENYLRKQSSTIRSNLLKNNPILPFAFLLYDEDIELLKELNLEINIHQIVPILSYKDINQTYNTHQFLCLYDNEMINADNLDSYLNELNKKLDEAKKQLEHYRIELESARDDSGLLKQFNFDKNYMYDTETKKEKIDNSIKSSKNEIEELQNEQQNILNQIEKYKTKINEIENQLNNTKEKIQKINEFIAEDESYLKNKQLSKSYIDSINNIAKQKEQAKKNIDNLNKDKEDNLKEKIKLDQKIINNKSKLQSYVNADEALLIDDTIENMEERIQALKNAINSSLKWLEKDYKNKTEELKDKQNALKSYNLEQSEYEEITYDKDQLIKLQTNIKKLQEDENNIDQNYRETRDKLQNQKGKLEIAEVEVKKLADSPIEPSLIKLNFNIRRKEGKQEIQNSNNKIKQLRKVSIDYEKITNRIEGKADVRKYEVNIDYKINKNVNEDYKELTNQLTNLKKENEQYEANISSNYYKIKSIYNDKNKHIQNIFKGLDTLIDKSNNNRNKYYYLGERILLSNESLNKLIRACQQRLSNVEKNKKDMIQHSYLHGKQVYDEIQKIADNSSIKLEGKSRPIPMLKINMVPLEETEEENNTKMKEYIETCVTIIKEDMKENKKTEEIRKKISKYMSTKELLNVLSDLGKMSIDAYKIDINMKNSKYKTWEQVMKENSGGERFVSFFAVLVALMSYTRTSMKLEDDYQRNKDTKVLIMDNPFGPISSEHLLKPLFKIASKYNTQLICLTDLKQNSILNCFNLIYIIKIRQNTFGTNEYIHLEQQIKEESTVEKDEMLEKVVFKAEEVEQVSLF